MIVCKRCGNHNTADSEFCASCGVFLEWEGERIGEPADDSRQPLPPPTGLVTRIKNAVLGDGPALPPPRPNTPASEDRHNPTAKPVSGRKGTRPDTPSALLAKPLAPPPEQQPAPQAPTAAVPRPKPQIKQPPTRSVGPGDLVCGTCGEVNGPERNFCRRCATSLAEVVPVRRRWWHLGRRKRATADRGRPERERTDHQAVLAGTRPNAASGRSAGAGRARKKARRAKGIAFGGFNSVRRVLALLAILGIGTGIAVPSLRATITNKAGDILNSVKRAINPEYTDVNPDPTLSLASSAADGHDATLVADGGSNTFWVGAPDATEATVTVTFTPPTDLAKILITAGDQEEPANFKRQPRPKDLFVTAHDAAGTLVKSIQITVDDSAEPQEFELEAGDVTFVSVAIQSCYPDPALHICALSELEFFKEK